MNVLIAMPCYQGQVHVNTSKCIMNLVMLLSRHDIRSEYFTLGSESLIPRGRNACVAYFLSKEDFTHLLFIDADVVFDPHHVLTLLMKGESISGCPYPKKVYDWNHMVAGVLRSLDWDKLKDSLELEEDKNNIIKEQLTLVNQANVMARMMSYVYNPLGPEVNVENGWMEVSEIGTGFMLIKKDVIDKMVINHPELKYINDVGGYNALHPNMKDNFYLFFDCRCEPFMDSQRYLSEDYAFCKLAKNLGFKIWLYTNAVISHTGSHTFTGNMLHSLALLTKDNE